MMDDDKPIKKDYEKIPLIYLYIYKKLAENFRIGENISYKNLIHHITKMTYHIPRKYDDIIIKELIDFNLLEKSSGGRSPVYELGHEAHQSRIKELDKIKKSGLRFKIIRDKYEKLLKDLERVESLDQKYKMLKCDYEKFLRKLELKKLEGSHYW